MPAVSLPTAVQMAEIAVDDAVDGVRKALRVLEESYARLTEAKVRQAQCPPPKPSPAPSGPPS